MHKIRCIYLFVMLLQITNIKGYNIEIEDEVSEFLAPRTYNNDTGYFGYEILTTDRAETRFVFGSPLYNTKTGGTYLCSNNDSSCIQTDPLSPPLQEHDSFGLSIALQNEGNITVCTPLRPNICDGTILQLGYCYTGTEYGKEWSNDSLIEVAVCPEFTLDIIFVLDGSNSVYLAGFGNGSEFQRIKNWVLALTELFDITPNGTTHVGVIQYSSRTSVDVEIELGQYQREVFINSVENIQQSRGATYIALALGLAAAEFQKSPRLNDTYNSQVLILLTDGLANDRSELPAESAYVRSLNITPIAVGVGVVPGPSTVREQLQTIATGEIGNDERVYQILNFNDLATIVESIFQVIETASLEGTEVGLSGVANELRYSEIGFSALYTKACAPLRATYCGNILTGLGYCYKSENFGQTWNPNSLMEQPVCNISSRSVEILFVVDGSNSIFRDNPENFNITKDWINDVVSRFDISPGGSASVGVIQYSADFQIRVEVPLGQFSSQQQFTDALIPIVQFRGSTFTGIALQLAVDIFLNSTQHRDPNNDQVIVLLTDGTANDGPVLPNKSEIIRDNNITPIAIGVGDMVELEQLQIVANGMAGNNTRVFLIDGFNDLTSIIGQLFVEIQAASLEGTDVGITGVANELRFSQTGFDATYGQGFFPMKPVNENQSSFNNIPPIPVNKEITTQLINEEFKVPKTYDGVTKISSQYKKLVLTLVDAMTIDFAFGAKHKNDMPFLHSLIKQGHSQSFISIANAPTVTMPRIKALTTGSLPAYIDIILNLESAQLKEDNIVNGLNKSGKKLLFYGDDTWLKLFPDSFIRKEGVTSFFVKDYTEVDQNVTRNLDVELHKNKDWQVLILHYLGLDHIGHLVGPTSTLVPTKLKEMDSVIKSIYNSLKENELLVLTSDHGMGVGGSHGGTTHPETHTPLVFLSPSIRQETNRLKEDLPVVEQVDFASTVSILMGIPIPSNSIGKLIYDALNILSKEDKLHSLQYNCQQLLSVASLSSKFVHLLDGSKDSPLSNYRNGIQFHNAFLNPEDFQKKDDLYKAAEHNYLECSKTISSELSSNLASYNYAEMGMGIIIMCLGLCGVLYFLFNFILQSLHQNNFSSKPGTKMLIFMVLGSFLHLSSLASSSFVEEEHQTWYFLSISALLGLCVLSAQAVNQIEDSPTATKTTGNSLYDAQIKADKVGVRLRKETASWKLSYNSGGENKSGNPENLKTIPTIKKGRKTYSGIYRMVGLGLIMLILHRVLRNWNQTGVKHAEDSDIEDWLNQPDNKTVLTLISMFSLFGILFVLELLCSVFDIVRTLLSACAIVYVYLYRVQTGSVGFQEGNAAKGIYEARIVYLFLFLIFLKAVYHLISDHCYGNNQSRTCIPPRLCCPKTSTSKLKLFDSIQSFVILLASLLLRPHNLATLFFHLCLYWIVFRYIWPFSVELCSNLLTKPWKEITRLDSGYLIGPYQSVIRLVAALWFGKLAYFNLGNSNSFATIDLSSGYIGLSSSEGLFNTVISMFLATYTTYIGEIVWLTLCVSDLVKLTQMEISENTYNQPTTNTIGLVTCTLAAFRLVALTVYVAVATGHRYHLFVWSVFAPKLLYEVSATVVFGWVLFFAVLLW